MECIDAIEAAIGPCDAVEGFLVGQVMKYLWRFKLKGRPFQDLRKAEFYFRRLLAYTEAQESKRNGIPSAADGQRAT